MNPDHILALLPEGERPAVAITADGAVTLTYTAASHAARVSADDAAIRARFDVLSAEQTDVDQRGGDGCLITTDGFRVTLRLAPKSKAPKSTNG